MIAALSALQALPVTSTASPPPNICPDGGFSTAEIIVLKDDYSVPEDELAQKWHLIVNGKAGADAVPAAADGGCRITVKSPGKTAEDIRLCVRPLSFTSGMTYRLTFSARTQSSRTIDVCFDRPGAEKLRYGEGTVTLNPGTGRYSFEFDMTGKCTRTARLWFGLGESADDVWIGDVSVEML